MRTIVLVACVKDKLSFAAPARLLYQSKWFNLAQDYAEQFGDKWYILSAKHGLLHPGQVIAPYDVTLRDWPANEKQRWAERVLAALLREELPPAMVTMLAGDDYRRYLVPLLEEWEYIVDQPLAYLRIGQQMAWLKNQSLQSIGDPRKSGPVTPGGRRLPDHTTR